MQYKGAPNSSGEKISERKAKNTSSPSAILQMPTPSFRFLSRAIRCVVEALPTIRILGEKSHQPTRKIVASLRQELLENSGVFLLHGKGDKVVETP
jgi:hypothetical protein